MAKDPYGNEIDDPFDKAIAQGVMRSTWSSAILSVVFALSAGCCVPVSSLISASLVPLVIAITGLLSLAAAANVVIRVFTMQSEHKELIPSWHPWAALGLALCGAALGALQLLGITAQFVMMSVAGA